MIRILGRNNSIAVQKVLWTCADLNLNFFRDDVGGKFGFPHDYEKLNPNMKVPCLIDSDEFVLLESHSICKYLVGKYGNKTQKGFLYPVDDLKRKAKIDQWMDWKAITLYPHVQKVFFTLVRTPPEKRDLNVLRDAKIETYKLFKILNDDFISAKKNYVVGDHFSLADIPLAICAHRWYSLVDKAERLELPALDDW